MTTRLEVDSRRAAFREQLHRYARRMEMRRRMRTLSAVRSPRTLAEVVAVVSPLRGHDARQAAEAIRSEPVGEKAAALLAEEVASPGLSMEDAEYLRCQVDYEYFAQKYLSHHFTKTYTDPVTGRIGVFHRNFHADLARVFTGIAYRHITTPTVIAGFPESGKTTMCSLLFPLHNICHGGFIVLPDSYIDLTKRFHLFVSAVETNARRLLGGVLEELESNVPIASDYGLLYHDPSTGKKGAREWAAAKATTTNGVHLEAKSRRAKFRTLKWRQYRPDLGIADDIETDDGVTSRAEREKTDRFFFNVFIPRFAEDRGSIIILGNLLDEQSLMAQLVRHGKKAGWETRVYKLYDSNKETGEKEYLMPEHYGARYEAEKRGQLMGDSVAFRQEYLQDPSSHEAALRLDSFQTYAPSEYARVRERCYRYVAVDPSASASKRADYTAIVPIAWDPDTGDVFVLPCVEAKLEIGEQISTMAHVWVREQPYAFGVESVAYQKVVKPLLEDYCAEQGFAVEVREIKQDTGLRKAARISRLFPSIKTGRIKFLAGNKEHSALIDQLISLSRKVEPDYDDLADALEMAVRMRDQDAMVEYEGEGSADAATGGDEGLPPAVSAALDAAYAGRFIECDRGDYRGVRATLLDHARGFEDEGEYDRAEVFRAEVKRLDAQLNWDEAEETKHGDDGGGGTDGLHPGEGDAGGFGAAAVF